MRGASVAALVVSLGGCTGLGANTDGATKGGRSFVHDGRFCVPEAWTVELPADRQAPVQDPVGACGNYVDERAMKENPISCGPCGFVLDSEATRTARKKAADACCYEVSSPSPPQPPPT